MAHLAVVRIHASSGMEKISKPRAKYADLRTREFLTESEIALITKAAAEGRHGSRDQLLVIMAFRHGLRAKEVCGLQWGDLDLEAGRVNIRRAKNGENSTHPLGGDEIRKLRAIKRLNPEGSRFVFLSERGGPITTSALYRIVANSGLRAGLEFPIHPHMLRHACGYKLANDGQDTRSLQIYLGHKNIRHTEHYTKISSKRFEGFFKGK
jgi:type 1 fimbriae regulatory protein FimE